MPTVRTREEEAVFLYRERENEGKRDKRAMLRAVKPEGKRRCRGQAGGTTTSWKVVVVERG